MAKPASAGCPAPGLHVAALMFSEEEIEALGARFRRWGISVPTVRLRRGGQRAGEDRRRCPRDLRDTLDDSGLPISPGEPVSASATPVSPKIRAAIRNERKLGSPIVTRMALPASARSRPFAVGSSRRCESSWRGASCARDFRHFRTDRTLPRR